ncbi:MAG: SecE/Sec61-gamma subunit of protein translocation complex [Chlamydiales bacterium]|jgi:preprotein translocase SecE subunit|nr:SecE/Sec61-gamma subunit of protein translocation complex [Chlamydiales bacterium]
MSVESSKASNYVVQFKSKKLLRFFGETKEEIKKIHWTTAAELQVYTKVIVIAAFALGMVIYLNDLIVGAVLYVIHSLINAVMG